MTNLQFYHLYKVYNFEFNVKNIFKYVFVIAITNVLLKKIIILLLHHISGNIVSP